MPPPVPVLAEPPPIVEEDTHLMRVPITDLHTVSLPKRIIEERTEFHPVERTVYETVDVPETVFDDVEHVVAVPTTRHETIMKKMEIEVPEIIEVSDVEYETHIRQVPRVVIRQQIVPRKIIEQRSCNS